MGFSRQFQQRWINMIIRFGGKVSDMFWLRAGDIEYEGYVPSDIGIGGGDYIEISVDAETGQILNWNPLMNYEKHLRVAIGGESVEDDEHDK